ncbi:MAG: hypothetical protein FWF77_09155 [Defluviitaleaceae bacterium]|nr:hypothetical protein [Defluviitaleaceae bacterium]
MTEAAHSLEAVSNFLARKKESASVTRRLFFAKLKKRAVDTGDMCRRRHILSKP